MTKLTRTTFDTGWKNLPPNSITRRDTSQCSTAKAIETHAEQRNLGKKMMQTWLRFASDIASEMRRATCSTGVNVLASKSSAGCHLGVDVKGFCFIIEVTTG
jgi:urease accessory protein UreF